MHTCIHTGKHTGSRLTSRQTYTQTHRYIHKSGRQPDTGRHIHTARTVAAENMQETGNAHKEADCRQAGRQPASHIYRKPNRQGRHTGRQPASVAGNPEYTHTQTQTNRQEDSQKQKYRQTYIPRQAYTPMQ